MIQWDGYIILFSRIKENSKNRDKDSKSYGCVYDKDIRE